MKKKTKRRITKKPGSYKKHHMVLLVFFLNQITHSDDLKKIHFIICMAMDYFHNQFCWYVDLMTQMCMCFKKSIISFTKYKTKQNLLLIYLLIDKFFLIDYCDLILNLFLSFENLISNKKLLEENSWISLNIWKKTVKGIFGFVFFCIRRNTDTLKIFTFLFPSLTR